MARPARRHPNGILRSVIPRHPSEVPEAKRATALDSRCVQSATGSLPHLGVQAGAVLTSKTHGHRTTTQKGKP